jgi:hypothetical protein
MNATAREEAQLEDTAQAAKNQQLSLPKLQAASRKELQQLAKKNCVRANMKTSELIEALAALKHDGARLRRVIRTVCWFVDRS